MTEDIFNSSSFEKLKVNAYAGLGARPPGVDPQDNEWKNRHRVTGKLAPINYVNFFRYCTKNGWSFSSGLNALIATHPQINKEFKTDD